MKTERFSFWQQAGRILNAEQARSILLTGNIHDLFRLEGPGGDVKYVPLTDVLTAKWAVPDRILIVYEINGPIRFVREADREKVKDAWLRWRTGLDSDDLAIRKMLASEKDRADLEVLASAFETNLHQAVGNPTLALELLRQMCFCSRSHVNDKPFLQEDFIIVVEAADFALPEGDISRLSDADRHRISLCQDWFSDPGFMEGGDSVILIAESRSLINTRVARLPQILEVEVPAPDVAERLDFARHFMKTLPEGLRVKLWGTQEELAACTAGLSIHALRQLLKGACYQGRALTQAEVVAKVEEYIKSQVGEDVIEFKKPTHTLKSVVGFTRLKEFLRATVMPRLKASAAEALPGAAVCGPIGSGKTFIFEALAAELDIVVLVLKNIRSQWYGQTDVIFERLRRVLLALDKVLIFVDEADTQFGGVGHEEHSTERRLTGKIQAMMSDTALRGKVFWLLMTARIHLLSPDIRRPGRVGDLIIPVLDPEGEDREAFLQWVVKPLLKRPLDKAELKTLEKATSDLFAAGYAALRSELIARARGRTLDLKAILEVANDLLSPAIGSTRRYQTLQALVNCTRRSLLPDPNSSEADREKWMREIRALEAQGIG